MSKGLRPSLELSSRIEEEVGKSAARLLPLHVLPEEDVGDLVRTVIVDSTVTVGMCNRLWLVDTM